MIASRRWPGVAVFSFLVACGSDTITLDTTPRVSIQASRVTGMEPLSVQFFSSVQGGNGELTYDWDLGGVEEQQPNPHRFFDAAGSPYHVVLTVVDEDGDAGEAAVDIVVEGDTAPSITLAIVDPTSGEAPLPVAFACTVEGGNSPVDVAWSFGQGSNASQATTNFTYTEPGTYQATCTALDANGDSDSSANTIVVGNGEIPTATAAATPTSGEAPLEVSFTGTGDGGDGTLSYTWDFGDGGASSEQNPSHTYVASGSYSATLIVSDEDGDPGLDVVTIVVTDSGGDLIPVVTADGTPTEGAAPLEVDFKANGSGGDGALSYEWSFGDSATSTEQNPTHIYADGGAYSAVVRVTDDDGDQGFDVVTIRVDEDLDGGGGDLVPELTTASATPQIGDAPLLVTFSASASSGDGVLAFHWEFGDGGSADVAATSHSYGAGTYSATVTVTDEDGDLDFAVFTIEAGSGGGVNHAPVANAGTDFVAAVGQVVSLDATASTDPDGDILGYTWTQTAGPATTFDDNSLAEPSFRPRAAGTYTFEVEVSDNQAWGTATVTVAVHSLAVGRYASFTISPAQAVSGWGSVDFGAGDTEPRDHPTAVCFDYDDVAGSCTVEFIAAAIARGGSHQLAVDSAGVAWAWGANTYGQLGDGCTSCLSKSTPGQVINLTGLVAVAAGDGNSLALDDNGTVWAWGSNWSDNLGPEQGHQVHSSTPIEVTGLPQIVAISTGQNTNYALDSDGMVWAWGKSSAGELGDGCDITSTCGPTPTPTQVCVLHDPVFGTCLVPLTDIVTVAGGYGYALALDQNGVVWAWGANTLAQLGDGCQSCTSRFRAEPAVSGARDIAVGKTTGYAVLDDGTVSAWGHGRTGELGNGCYYFDCPNKAAPGLVCADATCASPLAGVVAVRAYSNVLALLDDGSMVVWGSGVLGDDGSWQEAATAAPGLGCGYSDLAPGFYHVVAIANGNLYAWGAGRGGNLGDGCTIYTDCDNRAEPVLVASGSPDWVWIDAGLEHSLARRSDGTLWAWGENGSGELGTGAAGANQTSPVQVLGIDGVTYDNDWAEAFAGDRFSVARKTDGTLWAWGENSGGELGIGEFGADEWAPVQVLGSDGETYDDDWVEIATYDASVLARKDDHSLWAWGNGDSGMLGVGDWLNHNKPTQVLGPDGVTYDNDWVEIAGGESFFTARKSDKSLWGWGDGRKTGIGCQSCNSNYPAQVVGRDGVTYDNDWASVAASRDHVIATKDDGTIWAWGGNDDWQLGDGSSSDAYVPVAPCASIDDCATALTDASVVEVYPGGSFTLARDSSGCVLVWGGNNGNMLGMEGPPRYVPALLTTGP